MHRDLGGKRGSTVFAKPHSAGFAEIPFDAKYKFASAVDTDDNGVARIVFCPSRIGGDTYKLRVFVGPPTQDTTSGGSDVYETGTMVRWRSVRVCHDIVMDPPDVEADAPAESCKKADGSLMPNVSKYFGDLADLDLTGAVTTELAKSYCELIIEPIAEQPVSISLYGDDIKTMAVTLARNYPRFNTPAYSSISIHREPMAVVLGTGDLQFRVVLQTPPEQKAVTVRPQGAGYDAALALDESGAMVTKAPVTAVNVDYATGEVVATFSVAQTAKQFDVCYQPAKYVDINELLDFPDISPFLFNLALPRIYNARIGALTKPAPVNLVDETAKPGQFHDFIDARVMGLAKALLSDAAVRGVNLNAGFYPGLLFFRARRMDNYTSIWETGSQDGKGVGNGIFLFGGGANLDVQKFLGLTVHEMSHGLLLMHAPTAPGCRVEEHDAADNYCVMSYDTNDGDHCGQCTAALRGINTRLKPQFP